MAIRGYYLGCPAWAVKTWSGRLFPRDLKPTEYLAHYARVFNAVEGNTTFYALPKLETVQRWADDVPDTFRFCFKFPQTITHDKLLVDCKRDVETFLARLAPLGAKLGTLFIQLPAHFGPGDLGRLDGLLRALPDKHRYAVELRDPIFFQGGPEERDAAALLRSHAADTVILDARGLHASDDPAYVAVRAKKPNLPIVMRATGPQPMVRCVPHERFEAGRSFVSPWIGQLGRWIAEGRAPYFFMHAPDDTYSPENAYAFHAMLAAHVDVGDLPPWPAETPQLGLF